MEITVSNPEKSAQGGIMSKGHTTYAITTKTELDCYAEKEFFVRRRYNDFVWLVNELQNSLPHIWVPPIPEKQLTGRFKEETIENRQRGLQRFCSRIAKHEVLRECEAVKTFLEAKNWELKGEKKGTSGGAVSNLFHKVTLEIESKVANHKNDPDHAEFDLLKMYLTEFSKNVKSVQASVHKMTDKQADMADELATMGEAFNWLAQGETDLTDALTGFGQSSSVLSKMIMTQAGRDDMLLNDILKEYDALATQGLRSLKERDMVISKVTDVVGRLKHKNEDLVKAQGKAEIQAKKEAEAPDAPKKKSMFGFLGGNKDANETVSKLEKEIEQKETEKVSLEKSLKEMSDNIRSEGTHFHDTKITDFKDMLRRYIDDQVTYAEKLAETWRSLRPTVDALDKVVKVTPGHGERLAELKRSRGKSSEKARVDDAGNSGAKDDESGVKDDTDVHQL